MSCRQLIFTGMHSLITDIRGNALFVILIAVALFAALSYAVTQSGRGSGTINREQASLVAAQIVSYGNAVRNTIQKLRLINNCADTQIAFSNPITDAIVVNTGWSTAPYIDTPTPSDKSCYVFNNNGGGMTFNPAPAGAQNTAQLGNANYHDHAFYWFNANNGFDKIATDAAIGGASSAVELTMGLSAITDAVCDEINKNLKITGSVSGHMDVNNDWSFRGVYNNWGAVGRADATGLSAQPAGCIKNIGDGLNYYYQVLIER